jgi:alcohol dehydrogenase class IV
MTSLLTDPIRFCFPGRVLFGAGIRRDLPGLLRHLGFRRAVLVTDKFFARPGGAAAELAVQLEQQGIGCVIFDGCQADPSLALCDAATKSLRGQAGADCVIAVGGGSNIDLAKVLTLTLRHEAPAASFVGTPSLPCEPLPLVAVPTTAGTASEITPGAILVAADGQTKVAVMDNKLRAQVAVIDPELTVTCPPRVTADAGIDALAHAIESYITQDAGEFGLEGHPDPGYSGRNPLTRLFALEAIKLCFQYLERAYRTPTDMEARSGMALASLYAGFSYGNAGLHGVHALAYGVAAATHETHGTTNAVMLPYVMADLADHRTAELSDMARVAGLHPSPAPSRAAAIAVAGFVRSLIAAVGLPTSLESLNIEEAEVPAIAAAGLAVQRLTKAYPAPDAAQRYAAIARAAYDGRLPADG